MSIVPFKTPTDYFVELLGANPANLDNFYEIWKANPEWHKYDNDLHIYPYVTAYPVMLSAGCRHTCPFCPTGQYYKGKVYRGDYKKILRNYLHCNIHFMDEDFFDNNKDDMDDILKELERLNIKWLAMTHNATLHKVVEKYGEDHLFDCGLVCVEVGLENVALMMKVKPDEEVKLKKIAIYYLNMSLLPGETKETIRKNALWMGKEERTLLQAIHFNNGVWFAPGQYYFPYGEIPSDGIMLNSPYARTMPTYVPNTLLKEECWIMGSNALQTINHYAQLTYGVKMYNPKMSGIIEEFIDGDPKRLMWLMVGLRIGSIK